MVLEFEEAGGVKSGVLVAGHVLTRRGMHTILMANYQTTCPSELWSLSLSFF